MQVEDAILRYYNKKRCRIKCKQLPATTAEPGPAGAAVVTTEGGNNLKKVDCFLKRLVTGKTQDRKVTGLFYCAGEEVHSAMSHSCVETVPVIENIKKRSVGVTLNHGGVCLCGKRC